MNTDCDGADVFLRRDNNDVLRRALGFEVVGKRGCERSKTA